MPVKLNPTGQYNLNFIDWDNEWERVFEYQSLNNPNISQAPIDGMDIATFEALYDQYMAEEIKESMGVKEDVLMQIPIKTVVKEDPNRMCAICLKVYVKGQKVFFLACKHHFHIDCLKPWFDKNHVCPNCRYNLNEGKPAE
jgi:E3 ubiquitin-protein ligase RNF181